jgi:hypothetical protein
MCTDDHAFTRFRPSLLLGFDMLVPKLYFEIEQASLTACCNNKTDRGIKATSSLQIHVGGTYCNKQNRIGNVRSAAAVVQEWRVPIASRHYNLHVAYAFL